MNAISHWQVTFLAPYPTHPGERKVQTFYNEQEAIRMKDYYNSLGAYDARVSPVGREYQYLA